MYLPRKPGRPPGASWLNEGDAAHLARIADVMIKGTVPNLTAAMREAGVSKDADHRRLRNKWKAQGPTHLAAAHARRHAELEARWSAFLGQVHSVVGGIARGVVNAQMKAAEALDRWSKENPEAAANARRLLEQMATVQKAAKKGRDGRVD